MTPLVSIVTVCLDSELYIAQALASVESQTYTRIEHIIVDGGSTDSTLHIIEQYRSRPLPYSTLLLTGADNGLYDALNKGIAKASGALIGIVHSDDRLSTDAVERIVGLFSEQNGRPGVYRGAMRYCSREGYLLSTEKPAGHFSLYIRDINHPAWFVESGIYRTCGVYDTAFAVAADWDLYLRLHRAAVPFFNTDAEIVTYRLGGMSSRKSPGMIVRRTRDDWAILKKNGFGLFTRCAFIIAADIIIPTLKILAGKRKGRISRVNG